MCETGAARPAEAFLSFSFFFRGRLIVLTIPFESGRGLGRVVTFAEDEDEEEEEEEDEDDAASSSSSA